MKTYRHEQKYLIHEAQYLPLRSALSALMERDSHVGPDGEYMLRSLYFDDMYRTAYEDKMAGVYARKKYRIRVYDCARDRINLECKYKQGPYISKESLSLSVEEYECIRAGECGFLLGKDSPMAREFYLDWQTRLLRPVAVVDYEREPYVMNAGTVRITFDKNLRAVAPSEGLFDVKAPSRAVLAPGQLIMEVKFTGYLPERVRRIFATRNMTQTSASKFCMCVDRLNGVMPRLSA